MMKKLLLFLALLFIIPVAQAGVNGQLRQGGHLYQDKKYGAAINVYRDILKHNPNDQHALFNTGNAHYRLQEYTQAAENYKQAAQANGDYAQHALYNLGNTYYRAGKKQEAIEAYKAAILQNPQDKEAIHNLQFILQQKEQNKDDKQNNQQNQNQSSDNQSDQPQQNQGQAPQESSQEQQPQQGQLSKSDADRVMSMAKEQEYKPGAPSDRGAEKIVEKDW